MDTTYTAIQKRQIWASLTRKHVHKLPSFAVTENNSYQFDIPKSRYLSKIYVLVEGTYKVTHASETTWTAKRLSPFRWIKNISIDINNGFSPFKCTGEGAYLMGLVNPRNIARTTVASSASTRGANILTGSAGSSGSSNTIKFMLELPLTINDRDSIGYINASDPTTNIIAKLDTGDLISDLLATTTGFTAGTLAITVTPFVESFTIPVPNPISKNPLEHLLDISLIKLVQSESKVIGSVGEDIIKISKGTTFRKIVIDVHDGSDTALTDAEITNFQLALNQGLTIFNMTAKQLQALNQLELGYSLPAGVFVLDFSYQGIPNYGGSRDYIDSQNLNEFWIKQQFAATGVCNIHYESIAKMK